MWLRISLHSDMNCSHHGKQSIEKQFFQQNYLSGPTGINLVGKALIKSKYKQLKNHNPQQYNKKDRVYEHILSSAIASGSIFFKDLGVS